MIINEFLEDKSVCEHCKTAVINSEIILADNVAEYMYQNRSKEWDMVTEFPNCVPPFALMTVISKWPGAGSAWELAIVKTSEADRLSVLDGTRWEAELTLYWKIQNAIVEVQVAKLYIGHKGTLQDKEMKGWFNEKLADAMRLDARPIPILSATTLMTISFMNCKNVALNTIQPSDRLNHARIKRGRTPHLTYKVLDIHPMKRILETEGRVAEVGLQKALHICRGHFKNFDDRPLFGKLRGQYWWDSHVRGDIKHGAVIKDYNVFAEAK